jgi:hypothetical protein
MSGLRLGALSHNRWSGGIMVNYCSWYSNNKGGKRKKKTSDPNSCEKRSDDVPVKIRKSLPSGDSRRRSSFEPVPRSAVSPTPSPSSVIRPFPLVSTARSTREPAAVKRRAGGCRARVGPAVRPTASALRVARPVACSRGADRTSSGLVEYARPAFPCGTTRGHSTHRLQMWTCNKKVDGCWKKFMDVEVDGWCSNGGSS